jgi:hypothetical protein
MVNLLGRDQRQPPTRISLDAHTQALLAERLPAAFARAAQVDGSRPLAQRHRTPDLEPDVEDEPSLAGFEAALHELAGRRRALLPGSAAAGQGPDAAVSAGARLVVVEVDTSVADGLAEAASRGFFDLDDRPPWDLWLVAFGVTRPSQPEAPGIGLVALVPEDCIAVAEAGRRAGGRGHVHPLVAID